MQISLNRHLFQFWVLDCAALCPANIVMSDGRVFACDMNGLNVDFSASESNEILLDMERNRLVKINVLATSKVPGQRFKLILTFKGGRLWERLARPRWHLYVNETVNPGSRFSLKGINRCALVNRASELVRQCAMSKNAATRFQVSSQNRVFGMLSRIVYWKKPCRLFKIELLLADLKIECNELDPSEEHLEWVYSVFETQKWRSFGFADRYCDVALAKENGDIKQDDSKSWQSNKK